MQLGQRRYAVSGSTRAEAVSRLNELVWRYRSGTLDLPHLSVAQWLTRWLEQGRESWKPTTFERYADIVRLCLAPAIGQRDLDALSRSDIARCLATCSGVSNATRLRVYRVLHRALAVAVYEGLLDRNPAATVEPPRATRRTPTLWTVCELETFLDATQHASYGHLWAILVGTGCRLGEALALRWADYDHGSGVVDIHATLSETRHGGQQLTPPKTPHSLRRVHLPGFARSLLSEQHSLTDGSGEEPIVTTRTGSSPTRALAGRALRLDCQRAGVPALRVHDLRHLHASLLIAEGIPLTTVSARLGHSSTAVTTAVYAHALRGTESLAAEVLDRLLFGSQRTH